MSILCYIYHKHWTIAMSVIQYLILVSSWLEAGLSLDSALWWRTCSYFEIIVSQSHDVQDNISKRGNISIWPVNFDLKWTVKRKINVLQSVSLHFLRRIMPQNNCYLMLAPAYVSIHFKSMSVITLYLKLAPVCPFKWGNRALYDSGCSPGRAAGPADISSFLVCWPLPQVW